MGLNLRFGIGSGWRGCHIKSCLKAPTKNFLLKNLTTIKNSDIRTSKKFSNKYLTLQKKYAMKPIAKDKLKFFFIKT